MNGLFFIPVTSTNITVQFQVLRNQRALEQHHLREHVGDKAHRCLTCGITFSWRENLIRHEQIHKDRPHVCCFCKKSFCTTDQLFQHKRTHANDIKVSQSYSTVTMSKPVGTYNRSYNQPSREELDNADLIRPYKCSVCDKRFQYSFSLEAHMKAHEDVHIPVNKGSASLLGSAAVRQPGHYLQKQHICTICNAAFQWPFSLVAHMKTHQNPVPIVKPSPKKKRRSYLRRNCTPRTTHPNPRQTQ